MTHSNRAFTLIEILIALVIFAIIGVIVSIGLRNIIQTNEHVQSVAQRLQRLEVAQTLLRNDLRQVIDRPIRNKDNVFLPALQLNNNVIEFTRGGITNPLNTPRQSHFQRLGYMVRNGQLIRQVWPVLDRVLAIEPEEMVLLDGVSQFEVTVFDKMNQPQRTWPIRLGTSKFASQKPFYMPNAIRLTYQLKGQGNITLTVAIPSRGYPDEQLSDQQNTNSR